jgi:ADP-dependent NAD(P)H-hydrate dehydratase / NAD(P)H-hydrate epimerase
MRLSSAVGRCRGPVGWRHSPPEALPLYYADQPGLLGRGIVRNEDLVDVLMDRRISGVLVGSGLPPDAVTREAVLTILSAARPTVVDGGGLTAFADRPKDLFIGRRGDIVLTPHEGEFERLFPDLKRETGKLDRARRAAERSGAVIVLKGADTVIAEPGGRAFINLESSPYLATAGSGDVLAGLILGLLVQGMPSLEAAAAAVWLHGHAGLACGPGLIAEDLPGRLPAILAGLVGDSR